MYSVTVQMCKVKMLHSLWTLGRKSFAASSGFWGLQACLGLWLHILGANFPQFLFLQPPSSDGWEDAALILLLSAPPAQSLAQ